MNLIEISANPIALEHYRKALTGRCVARFCTALLLSLATTVHAAPQVTENPQLNPPPTTTPWPRSPSVDEPKPDQTVTQSQGGSVSRGSSGSAKTNHTPAPPSVFAPIYKCTVNDKTSFQDTPCNNSPTKLYRTKGNPITPVYQ